jgi:hypothetical protein
VEGRSPPTLPFPKGLDPFSLFQISLENFFDLKFRLWKEHGLDPEWVEGIPYYEYQIWIDKLNLAIDADNQEVLTDSGKSTVFSFRK